MKSLLSLLLILGMVMIGSSRVEGEAKPSLAIVPFLVERVEDPGRGAVCPVCRRVYRSGEILPGSPNTLTRLLYQKMETAGTFEVLRQEKVEEAFLDHGRRRFEEKPIPSSMELGKELGADFLFLGFIFRFEERIGSSLGVEKPASVAFDIHLYRIRDEKMVWEGRMDETQRPLSENLFKVGSFFRRKASWLKAEDLARVGMDEVVRKLPEVMELQERP